MAIAILAGINLNKTNTEFDQVIQECINLCEACDIEVVDTCLQKSNSIDKKTGFRLGKVDELAEKVQTHDADYVVFYNDITVSITSRLEEECHCQVVDRTTLILMIFTNRARTKEAKLQIDMARLKYNLPRLLQADQVQNNRQRGGGVTNRGAGETRGTILRNTINAQIADLQKQLDSLKAHQDSQRKRRNQSLLKKVALVGYTNAGKSSVMNNLLARNNHEDKKVLQKDMLFATLDTSTRNIEYHNYEFLLMDTVGFVSDLPHDLIEAFKSTLDAARDADLLVHVIDASNPNNVIQQKITEDTLKQIGADNIPVIKIYNKSDLIDDPIEHLSVSCVTGQGIEEMLQVIIDKLYPNECHMKCLLPYDKHFMIDEYQKIMNIAIDEEGNDGSLIEVNCAKEYQHIFKPYEKE